MALWFFQRTAPGSIRRIPLPSMQRFLAGEDTLPHDGDHYVRCIGMAVELRNRKPSAVHRVWFSKIRVQGNGRVDPEHRPRVVREVKSREQHGSETVIAAATVSPSGASRRSWSGDRKRLTCRLSGAQSTSAPAAR